MIMFFITRFDKNEIHYYEIIDFEYSLKATSKTKYIIFSNSIFHKILVLLFI